MADAKISALTNASTPLAGTEVLPIVQGSTTKKVSVANLTAGRAVSASELTVQSSTDAYPLLVKVTAGSTSGVEFNDPTTTNNPVVSSRGNNLTVEVGGNEVFRCRTTNDVAVNLGNLVVGTAGKGINFSANANAPGMTSELLTWYEEGTWTPNQGAGLTVVGAFTSSGLYTRIGRTVTVQGTVTGATSVAISAANAVISSNLPYAAGTTYVGSLVPSTFASGGNVAVTASSVYAATTVGAVPSITFTISYTV